MTRTMTARNLRALVAAGVFFALIGACAPSTSEGDNGKQVKGKETTLSVWSWRTEDVAAYEKIFDVYEEEHPGTTVEFKPYKNTEYNTILATGLAEAGGPDVAQLRAYGLLQPLVEAGQLEPLDGEVEGLDEFPDQVLEGAKGRENGKIYGVPFAVQTLQLFYNKAIFADNGIEVPTTWDDLIAAAEKFKKAGVTPFATTGKDTWMLPIVHDVFGSSRYGAGQFEQDVQSGSADFTDKDYVASLAVVDQVSEFFPDDVAGVAYTDAQVLFTSGKAAMFPGGSFELGFFKTQAPDLDIGVFSAPPPPGSQEQDPVVPGFVDGSYGVNAKSKNKAAAKELVSWMATEEFGQLFADELKQISPVPGVEPSDPVVAEMAQAYAERPAPYLLLVDFRYGQPSGTDLLGAGLQKMLLGQSTPEQVAASLQKGISQWYRPGS